jgi:hypothetical protein
VGSISTEWRNQGIPTKLVEIRFSVIWMSKETAEAEAETGVRGPAEWIAKMLVLTHAVLGL